jgi:hypothetical protein
MSKVANSIRRGLKEAVAYARGEAKESAYRVHVPRYSDIRRIKPCARLNAVPPPNTKRNGAISTAVMAANALTTCQSFSTSVGLGSPKCCWISSNSWRDGLSLKYQFQIPVSQLTPEAALYANHRIDRQLCRSTFIVGPARTPLAPTKT